MVDHILHNPFVRGMRVVLGFGLIGSAITMNFAVATPVILFGAVTAACAFADINTLEDLTRALTGEDAPHHA
jgi:hypothetical protein